MSITLNGTEGITLDNGSADGAQVTLKSSGYSDWNLDNYSGTLRAYYNATEYFKVTSAGLMQFNSGYGSVATAYGCRAWVNFNGTGTVAIRASGNVSSITDNGTGNYTVNFTTSMPDANYSVGHAVKFQAGTTLNDTSFQFINSSGSVQVFTADDTNIAYDFAFICVQVFR